MGWKAIRDHYRIEHAVHVRDGNILIGSAYVTDLIAIMPTGAVRESSLGVSGELLSRYLRDLTADPFQLQTASLDERFPHVEATERPPSDTEERHE